MFWCCYWKVTLCCSWDFWVASLVPKARHFMSFYFKFIFLNVSHTFFFFNIVLSFLHDFPTFPLWYGLSTFLLLWNFFHHYLIFIYLFCLNWFCGFLSSNIYFVWLSFGLTLVPNLVNIVLVCCLLQFSFVFGGEFGD